MKTNRDLADNPLADSKSPFLRHGAEQPVDWLPWGEAAFDLARAQDRPLLLDIGAVWCHWCHVMDRESYDNAELATLINEWFVPVKVDRDERPDVDARYQRAVQVLTGQGGWPLTAFLTPDGDVYYGGTYFPPTDQHGRPSFTRVLREVARVWREERGRAVEAAQGIQARLDEFARAETAPGEPAAAMVDATLEDLAQSFDFRHGGFGRAPKFPNAGAVDLLLDRWIDAGTDWARRIVTETLTAMANGGIHDQLGGGFHRYATDARWLVPHFEKMAYDNGTLLATYARARVALEDGAPAEAAPGRGGAGDAAPEQSGAAVAADELGPLDRAIDGIIAYYRDVAPGLAAAGGFPASQDADVGDDDGDYWTWTIAELKDALREDRLVQAARLHFGFDDPGAAVHSDPSRHVLFVAADAAAVAARLGADAGETTRTLEEVYTRLKRARDARPRPFVDETLFAGWIALVASGYLAAARHCRRQDAAAASLAALERIWSDGFVDGRGIIHRLGDPDSGELLEDQALAAAAFVDAFELTQDAVHLGRAGTLMRLTLDRFRHDSGGLLDRPAGGDAAGTLTQPHLPIADAPVPAGNAVAALTLLRLAALTDDRSLHDDALRILRAFAGSAPRMASGAATYMKAVAWATAPLTTIVVVDDAPAAESELFRAALRRYRPRTVLRWFHPDAIAPAALPEPLRAMVGGAAPRAYVCAGTTCAAPVEDAAALDALLREFRGSP